jgi:hypothetical protein
VVGTGVAVGQSVHSLHSVQIHSGGQGGQLAVSVFSVLSHSPPSVAGVRMVLLRVISSPHFVHSGHADQGDHTQGHLLHVLV